ncbi:MAG: DNA_ligase_IV_Ku-like, partial [uncultured Nocardioidaceae bacterium]
VRPAGVRRARARPTAAPLRPPSGGGRGAALLGRPQGAAVGPPAGPARRARRGPRPRPRDVRGRDQAHRGQRVVGAREPHGASLRVRAPQQRRRASLRAHRHRRSGAPAPHPQPTTGL